TRKFQTEKAAVQVAVVERTIDARWSEPDGAKQKHAQVESGELLHIASGVVQLTLESGVSLTVEGPARWTITGRNQATLHAGRLLARVPSQAVGFTLETPVGRIVDLGTEFGVNVDESGSLDVYVIKG